MVCLGFEPMAADGRRRWYHGAMAAAKNSNVCEANLTKINLLFQVNFNELYDESYMGGKEYLRVLNELISDFDEILDRPEFRNVEKIKTIGAF